MTELQSPSPTHAQLVDRARLDLLSQFLTYWRGALAALAVVTVVTYLAGRSRSSPSASAVWLCCAFANCCVQATVCRAMELSDSPRLAMLRWHRWLLASIGLNGVFWGAVPWLVRGAGAEAVGFAALLDLMLLFCISSSPGTRQMILVATPPIGVLSTSALVYSGFHPAMAAGYAGLVALLGLCGLRLNDARVQGLYERFAAQNLAIELKGKQDELEAQQEKVLAMERERTLLLERQRLMRDMHDGLGASLVTSLVAAQRGDADPDRLAALLADCIDDLRAVIESLEPGDHDLATVLGTMRDRMDRRIRAAGIVLAWEVDDLPALQWMGPTEALQVMRFIQEVVTNCIKHSGARSLQVVAQARDAHVLVRIADDGRGFGVDAAGSGRGLNFLQQRATLLGATVNIQSSAGMGASVTLTLPIVRSADAVAPPHMH